MITEKTLSHLTGYTKNQIKRRRHNHWVTGVHFWRDEAGATIYSLEEIEKWQKMTQGSTKNGGTAKSFGTLTAKENQKPCQYPSLKLVSEKPQK